MPSADGSKGKGTWRPQKEGGGGHIKGKGKSKSGWNVYRPSEPQDGPKAATGSPESTEEANVPQKTREDLQQKSEELKQKLHGSSLVKKSSSHSEDVVVIVDEDKATATPTPAPQQPRPQKPPPQQTPAAGGNAPAGLAPPKDPATPRASAPGPKAGPTGSGSAELDQKLVARQERFGKAPTAQAPPSSVRADAPSFVPGSTAHGAAAATAPTEALQPGALAKSTVAAKRSASASSLGSGGPTAGSIPGAGVAGESVPPATPPPAPGAAAARPAGGQQVAAAATAAPSPPVGGARSSDGARNKAGVANLPIRPRGTAGVVAPVPTPSQEPSAVPAAVGGASPAAAAAAPMPLHAGAAQGIGAADRAPTKAAQTEEVPPPSAAALGAAAAPPQSAPAQVSTAERPPSKTGEDRPFAKPAQEAAPPLGLETAQPCPGLKRALDAFTQAPRKKPRLAAGDVAAWDIECKTLLAWLEEHLPTSIRHTKPDAVFEKCTDERLVELERWWQQVREGG